MVVIAYKWGGISFDDKSLIKTLTLPSLAKDNVPITFHDEAGSDYVVPGGKVFIVGKAMWGMQSLQEFFGRAGESATADGVISKELLNLSPSTTTYGWQYGDVLGVYAAGKYVTGESSSNTYSMLAGTTLYGIVTDA